LRGKLGALEKEAEMKTIFGFLAVLALAGCATTIPPSQTFKADDQQKAVRIGGEYNSFTTAVKITINGQTVIEDSMGFWRQYKEFSGEYQGKSVLAGCDWRQSFFDSFVKCNVFIDDVRAAELTFK
jgi:hypothetical protein